MSDLCMLPDTNIYLLATNRDHLTGICHIRLGYSRPRKCRWCRGRIYSWLLSNRLDNNIAYLRKPTVPKSEAEMKSVPVKMKA
jgi:hypothetical protein